jgi:hypothetical protein
MQEIAQVPGGQLPGLLAEAPASLLACRGVQALCAGA